ncbi:Hypothetical protein ORPV_1015 [Orpheovirus IHUMI-LCC2]|uniref:Uncharacterized protein n=1 Tax=Orpheovirus IHUMI-LCC2 TaxID=2023057 RepID=A0A2I2L633_9VIRU|nr:Hypothetical protein ORPV_1015 [Orpheovirus IHUMI-LCC2]SNW62919.1 Hypothetical protein ORPV_1015 [Orpheovirus IHUMI-LCC2]
MSNIKSESQILQECETFFKDRLTYHGISYEGLCSFLKKTEGIVTGSFIISCLLGKKFYHDIDIFISREVKGENLCKTFEGVMLDKEYYKGVEFNKTPVSVSNKDKMTLSYHRSADLQNVKIDICTTDKYNNAKDYIEAHTNFDFLRSYFDGDNFVFNFDIITFYYNPTGRLEFIENTYFDIVYDPWGLDTCIPNVRTEKASRTMPDGSTHEYNISIDEYTDDQYDLGTLSQSLKLLYDLNVDANYVGLKDCKYTSLFKIPNDMMSCISKVLSNRYNTHNINFDEDKASKYLQYDRKVASSVEVIHPDIDKDRNIKELIINIYEKIRKMYQNSDKGKEDNAKKYTMYRLYKTLMRCVKYESYGVHILNVDDYFKTYELDLFDQNYI